MNLTEFTPLEGAKIIKVIEGLDGLILVTDKGNFELDASTYPDGSYSNTVIEQVTDEYVKDRGDD